MADSNTLFVNLDVVTAEFNTKINNALSKLEGLGSKALDVGKKLSLSVSAPLLLMGYKSVKAASDIEESINKVNVAFKESSNYVKQWSANTINSLGISSGHALDMAALFGDMGTSMGIPTEMAAKMSTSLVGLTADLASFKNVSNDIASNALKGIFTGEGESLKSLGIIMQDSTLKAYAMEKGVKASYESMSQAEKVTLRYAYVMDAAKNAQGDYGRTAEGAANQMRKLPELINDTSAKFGNLMLPAFTKGVTKINELITGLNNLDADTRKNILIGAAFAVAIGPTLVAIGAVISSVKTIGLAFAGISAPVAGAIVLVGAFAYGATENFATLKNNLKALSREFYHFEKGLVSLLRLVNGKEWTDNRLQQLLDEFVSRQESIDNFGFGKNIMSKFSEGAKMATLDIDNLLKGIKGEGAGGSGKNVIDKISEKLSTLKDFAKEAKKEIALLTEELSFVKLKESNPILSATKLKNTNQINAEKMDLFNEIAKAVGWDGSGSGDKLQQRFQAIAAGISGHITNLKATISTDALALKELGTQAFMEATQAIGDTISNGFALMFSGNVDFKKGFRKILASFLQALGDMVMKMAVQLQAVAAIKEKVELALAGIGTGGIALAGAVGLFALGAAIKGGGMAMAGNANSSIASSSNYSGNSYQDYRNSNWGRSTAQNVSYPKTVQIEFKNGSWQGFLDFNNGRNGI
jgi:hypothetical protein